MATNPLPRRPPSPSDSPAGGPRELPPEPVTPVHALAPRQPGRLGRRMTWIAAGLLAGGIGLGGLLLATSSRQHQPGPLDCPGPPEESQEYTRLIQDANHLMREGKWTEARALLLEFEQREPNQGYLGDYLESVEAEISNKQHLVEAAAALSAGQLVKARTKLDAVKSNTMQYELADRLRQQLGDAVDSRVRDAEALLGNRQFDQARVIAMDALDASPEHARAMSILVAVESALLPPLPTGPRKAIDHFMEGDLPGALELAHACSRSSRPCKTELKALMEFSAISRKEPGKLGPQDLPRLVALDKRLTGTQTSSPLAQKFIIEARSKAREAFLMGYALKDTEPDEARKRFREVLALTLPDDETHQKAKNWLGRLKR